MKDFRIIIAGCRNMDDFVFLAATIDFAIQKIPLSDIEIVSGGQQSIRVNDNNYTEKYGADYLGEVYAKSRGLDLKRFPADWGKHGKAAGPIRNKEMAEYATHLIAFPSKLSKGTRNMIKLAEDAGLKIFISEI